MKEINALWLSTPRPKCAEYTSILPMLQLFGIDGTLSISVTEPFFPNEPEELHDYLLEVLGEVRDCPIGCFEIVYGSFPAFVIPKLTEVCKEARITLLVPKYSKSKVRSGKKVVFEGYCFLTNFLDELPKITNLHITPAYGKQGIVFVTEAGILIPEKEALLAFRNAKY